MAGITLDTGALIALERKRGRMPKIWSVALAAERVITVPSPVVIEWWRGQRGPIARLLDSVTDVVYTSDFDDLNRLAAYFPGVRVLRI